MTELHIRDLRVSIDTDGGEREILRGVNLTIKGNETHAVMGPNGSGKSTLGNVIAKYARCERVDLDRIHWDDMAFSHKREEAAARRLTREAAQGERWVIEGVYGWLASEAAPRATALIWIDLPLVICEASLVARGEWRNAKPGALEALLEWARGYETRKTPSSRIGHTQIFEAFDGAKLQISSRDEVNALIARLALKD